MLCLQLFTQQKNKENLREQAKAEVKNTLKKYAKNSR